MSKFIHYDADWLHIPTDDFIRMEIEDLDRHLTELEKLSGIDFRGYLTTFEEEKEYYSRWEIYKENNGAIRNRFFKLKSNADRKFIRYMTSVKGVKQRGCNMYVTSKIS